MNDYRVIVKWKDEKPYYYKTYFMKAENEKQLRSIIKKTTEGNYTIVIQKGVIKDNTFFAS